MKQIWRSVLASFYLMGIAGVTTAAAISSSIGDVDARAYGRAMMIDAQYRLAVELRR